MTSLKFSSGNKSLKGLAAEDDFKVTLQYSSINNPASSGSGTFRDVLYNTYTYPSSSLVYTIDVAYPITQTKPVITKISGNSTLVDNVLTGTGSGDSVFTVAGLYGTRSYQVINQTGGYTQNTAVPYSFVSGTLAEHIKNNVVSIFNGKATVQDSVARWNFGVVYSENASGCSATPNSLMAAASLDLSWISFVRSNGPGDANPGFPCALISRRHIAVANHVGLPSKVIFRRNDGSFVEANIVTGAEVNFNATDPNSFYDLRIGYLDRDITGINPVLIFPNSGTHSLPNKLGLVNPSSYQYKLPSLISLHNDSLYTTGVKPPNGARYYAGPKILACDLSSLGSTSRNVKVAEFVQPGLSSLINFYFWPFGGDSSGKVFVPVMQSGVMKCVLVSSLYGAGSGPDYTAFGPQIEVYMRSLAASQGDNFAYTLTYVDLSAFPTI